MKIIHKILKGLIMGLLIFLLSGCYATTHVVGTGGKYNGNEIDQYDVKKKKWFLIYGAIPLDDVRADQLKGNATNYTVRQTHTFGDLVITGLTFGIAAPMTIRVSFAEGEEN